MPHPRATTAAWLTSHGGLHAGDVVGGGLGAHEYRLLAPRHRSHDVGGIEVRAADARAGRRGQAFGHDPLVLALQLRVEQLVEVLGRDPHHRLGVAQVDLGLGGHLHRDAQRGRPGALAHARLEHPELALLDGELGVEHVAVVVLEALEDVVQLGVDGREPVGQGRQRLGLADAGHDVLALGVEQEIAVGRALARRGIAREADAGAGGLVAVAEDHGLHVDGGAEVVGDVLPGAVGDGARAVPRVEHGLDRHAELSGRVLGERLAGLGQHHLLVPLHEVPQELGGDLGIVGHAGQSLGVLEQLVERGGVDAEHDSAEHGHEPPVGVEGEALVVGLSGQALHRLVVEAEVQDGVHHPRHRELGAGPHAHQERVAGVARSAAHGLLDHAELGGDLVVEPVRPTIGLEVRPTGVGRDGEARGHRQAEHRHHLGQARPLSPEQILEVLRRGLVRMIEGVGEGHVRSICRGWTHSSPNPPASAMKLRRTLVVQASRSTDATTASTRPVLRGSPVMPSFIWFITYPSDHSPAGSAMPSEPPAPSWPKDPAGPPAGGVM
jgi:hypothetical protein